MSTTVKSGAASIRSRSSVPGNKRLAKRRGAFVHRDERTGTSSEFRGALPPASGRPRSASRAPPAPRRRRADTDTNGCSYLHYWRKTTTPLFARPARFSADYDEESAHPEAASLFFRTPQVCRHSARSKRGVKKLEFPAPVGEPRGHAQGTRSALTKTLLFDEPVKECSLGSPSSSNPHFQMPVQPYPLSPLETFPTTTRNVQKSSDFSPFREARFALYRFEIHPVDGPAGRAHA